MNDKTWQMVGIITIACSIGMALVAMIKGGCPIMIDTAAGGSVPMRCHWAFRAVALVSCLSAVSAITAAVSREATTRRLTASMTLMLFAGAALVPTPLVIGICAGEGAHPCHATALLVWAICAVGAITSIFQLAKADPKRTPHANRFL